MLVFCLLWLFISCFSIQHPFCPKDLAWQQIFKKLNERVGGWWFKEKPCYCSFKATDGFFLFRYFSSLSFFSFVTQEKYIWYYKKLKMWNFSCKCEMKKKNIQKFFCCCFFHFIGTGGWDSVRRATEWCSKMAVPKSVIKIAGIEFIFH